MYNLAVTAKETASRPSDLLGIPEWTTELFGEPCLWTAYQFDRAVVYLSRWIESKLSEVDKQGKPIYQLEDLLSQQHPMDRLFAQFIAGAKAQGTYFEVK